MAGMHGYVRVSRRNGRGGDKYISPGEQERALREAAARIGVELVDIVVEEDVSGSLPPRSAGSARSSSPVRRAARTG